MGLSSLAVCRISCNLPCRSVKYSLENNLAKRQSETIIQFLLLLALIFVERHSSGGITMVNR